MKERLQQHLSDVGESFDYLRSDVRNLSRYMAELEELLEHYRAFALNAAPSTPADRAEIRRLLKKTHKVLVLLWRFHFEWLYKLPDWNSFLIVGDSAIGFPAGLYQTRLGETNKAVLVLLC